MGMCLKKHSRPAQGTSVGCITLLLCVGCCSAGAVEIRVYDQADSAGVMSSILVVERAQGRTLEIGDTDICGVLRFRTVTCLPGQWVRAIPRDQSYYHNEATYFDASENRCREHVNIPVTRKGSSPFVNRSLAVLLVKRNDSVIEKYLVEWTGRVADVFETGREPSAVRALQALTTCRVHVVMTVARQVRAISDTSLVPVNPDDRGLPSMLSQPEQRWKISKNCTFGATTQQRTIERYEREIRGEINNYVEAELRQIREILEGKVQARCQL